MERLDNPFVRGNVTRLKLLLPCNRKKAWKLIATPSGISSWFPITCKGRVAAGKSLVFGWPGGDTETVRVLEVTKGESLQTDWWQLGKVRYSVKGNDPTVFTLEVRYPKKGKGKSWQIPELVGWTFFLSNLKSIAMKGPDLRSNDPKRSWKKAFID